jgi:hypothetical protein
MTLCLVSYLKDLMKPLPSHFIRQHWIELSELGLITNILLFIEPYH